MCPQIFLLKLNFKILVVILESSRLKYSIGKLLFSCRFQKWYHFSKKAFLGNPVYCWKCYLIHKHHYIWVCLMYCLLCTSSLVEGRSSTDEWRQGWHRVHSSLLTPSHSYMCPSLNGQNKLIHCSNLPVSVKVKTHLYLHVEWTNCQNGLCVSGYLYAYWLHG